jgi:hypothetical protein
VPTPVESLLGVKVDGMAAGNEHFLADDKSVSALGVVWMQRAVAFLVLAYTRHILTSGHVTRLPAAAAGRGSSMF